MSESKFTPGQWLVNADRQIGGCNGDIAITLLSGTIVAVAFARRNPDEALANAHLIAAAPELYEALKTLYASVEKACGNVIPAGSFCWGRELAQKALAKAEGREE